MTDKEKIKAEIERMMSEEKAFFEDNCKHGNAESSSSAVVYTRLQMLLKRIDTLPEEPVSEQKLSNVERNVKNWKEEPVVIDAPSEDYVKGLADGRLYQQRQKEEPVSEELEVELKNYLNSDEYINTIGVSGYLLVARHFANWQKEQFEKNRLKHCDNITKEQAELEQGFIDQHLDKHQRMPTFLDAIEYGIRWQKQHDIDKACEWLEDHADEFQDSYDPVYNNDELVEAFRKAMED